jgi:ribosomal protein S18 acetylase RimI-like enzyme
MAEQLLPGYQLRTGSGLERAWLVKFMQQTYQELYPDGNFGHLAQTVEQYFSRETPLWWVEAIAAETEVAPEVLVGLQPQAKPIACLWLGNAVDQVTGDRHAHIFLLYVDAAHRRRGIGAALVRYAEAWARARGDRQLGLQVFHINQPARNLYDKLGFQPQSMWMSKLLQDAD